MAGGVSFLTQVSRSLFHLSVHVKPGARVSAVCSPVNPSDSHLGVRVAAPPVEGKANAELVDFLESLLTDEIKSFIQNSEEFLALVTLASPQESSVECCRNVASVTREKKPKSNQKKKKNSPQPVEESPEVLTDSRVSVSLVKGSTSREKLVAVEFAGSEAQLFALLSKSAA